MAIHNNIGKEGEKIASAFLKRKGYSIIHSNYRLSYLEIDLIAEDNEELVFIEVKTRTDNNFDAALLSVDYNKEQKLINAANYYLELLSIEIPIRFDVIAIIKNHKKWSVLHHMDAFSGFTLNFESNYSTFARK